MTHPKTLTIGQVRVPAGGTLDVHLEVSERYTGEPVKLPIRIVRGTRPGPTVFVTAGIHGDELNGVGILHELAFGPSLELSCGSLIMVLVVNVTAGSSSESLNRSRTSSVSRRRPALCPTDVT